MKIPMTLVSENEFGTTFQVPRLEITRAVGRLVSGDTVTFQSPPENWPTAEITELSSDGTPYYACTWF